jgi:hypothetical protein
MHRKLGGVLVLINHGSFTMMLAIQYLQCRLNPGIEETIDGGELGSEQSK